MSEPTADGFEAWESTYPFPALPDEGRGPVIRSVVRAAFAAGIAAERARLVALFTSGKFCRLSDHMQDVCDCDEYRAAILAPSR